MQAHRSAAGWAPVESRWADRARKLMVRWTTPLLLAGAVLLWFSLCARGLPTLLVTLGVAGGVSGVLFGLERLLPYPNLARRSAGTLSSDLIFNVVTMFSAVVIPSLVIVPAASAVGDILGVSDIWPTQLPTWANVVMCVLVVDFTSYWWHRWEHTSGSSWAWRLHSVHHSSTHFDVWMGAIAGGGSGRAPVPGPVAERVRGSRILFAQRHRSSIGRARDL